jgi:hypothetical protein
VIRHGSGIFLMTESSEPPTSGLQGRIVIIFGEDDDFHRLHYLSKAFIPTWEKLGIEVVLHRGPENPPPADVALLHVDLTATPAKYQALSQAYPKVLNIGVTDISKSKISDATVRRNDGYTGAVIVKTNNNSAGLMEERQALKRGGLTRLITKLRRRLPWYLRAHLPDYPILDSASAIPALLWLNRDLIVQRFQPERDGPYYCLRTWTFLGDRETLSLSYSLDPVVKGRTVVRREKLTKVPPELRAIRDRLGFDYGKFDYAIIDGRVVLYDVNRTPGLGGNAPSPELLANVEYLAQGIRHYL